MINLPNTREMNIKARAEHKADLYYATSIDMGKGGHGSLGSLGTNY
jgi:hypothetical protein